MTNKTPPASPGAASSASGSSFSPDLLKGKTALRVVQLNGAEPKVREDDINLGNAHAAQRIRQVLEVGQDAFDAAGTARQAQPRSFQVGGVDVNGDKCPLVANGLCEQRGVPPEPNRRVDDGLALSCID